MSYEQFHHVEIITNNHQFDHNTILYQLFGQQCDKCGY